MPRCFLTLALLLCASCVTPTVVKPVPMEASVAMAEARQLLREGKREEALLRAAAAGQVAQDWVGPRRFCDDLLRAGLLGPRVLRQYREVLEDGLEDSAVLYLAGRLEGESGEARFREALRLDPTQAWAWHGRAWLASTRGDMSFARRASDKAIDLARDSHDRAYFSWARARMEQRAGKGERAWEILTAELASPGLADVDRLWLEVELAQSEMLSEDNDIRRVGAFRAVRLLGEEHLTEVERRAMVEGALRLSSEGPGMAALHQACASDDRSRAALLALEGSSALALALRTEWLPPGASRRQARFAAGETELAAEEWLASVPRFCLSEGLPLDPLLREVVLAARSQSPQRIGAALLAAGWFAEARAYAGSLPGGDLDYALELDLEARRLEEIVDRFVRIGRAFDRGEAQSDPDLEASFPGRRLTTLAEWLREGAEGTERVAEVVTSPRLEFGLFGELVHPGPVFHSLDVAAGRGDEGEEVPGLAALMGDLGRFALFGKMLGQAPDGVILQRLLVIDEVRGEHLGVPWSGSVIYGEGMDLAPRASRAGARISAAALHDGYWIDVAVLREEVERWRALYERHDAGERARILNQRPAPALGDDPASTDHLLGAADRMRLAIMEKGPLPLEALCEVTAVHEEGHLCDRTRFLPLSENWMGAFALFASVGFSAEGLMHRLEQRAQLIALCEVPDPRIALVDLLAAAEAGGRGVTAHAGAYAELCERMFVLIQERAEAGLGPKSWDSAAFVGHQVHLLGREDVRAVALELAGREGLISDRARFGSQR